MTINPPQPTATPGYVPSSGLTIRRRAEHDGGALLELFNEERFQHFGTAMERFASVEDLQVWLDSLGEAKFEIVGDVDGRAVGYGRLQPFGDRQSHSGWIFLGVCEAFQRRGIGSALLQCLLATADILAGLQRIQLTVFSDNDVAIQLYRRFGFEVEGRHRRFLRRGGGASTPSPWREYVRKPPPRPRTRRSYGAFKSCFSSDRRWREPPFANDLFRRRKGSIG
jgi:putative acetyltransferase